MGVDDYVYFLSWRKIIKTEGGGKHDFYVPPYLFGPDAVRPLAQ